MRFIISCLRLSFTPFDFGGKKEEEKEEEAAEKEEEI